MITLIAQASYGYSGQYIARIEGRDPKYTFRRVFVGRKSGKRGDTTEADIDEPGLYETCDIGKKGKESAYRIVAMHNGTLTKLFGTRDNADGLDGKEAAMQIAKRLEAGETFEEIVEINAEGKYHIRTKGEAKRASVGTTVDAATEQCWAVLQALPEREAKKVLKTLRDRVSPPKPAAAYGTVTHDGKTLTITQQPYADGTNDSPCYRAAAQDSEGNLYRVIWAIVNPDSSDESEACDWKQYTVTPE